MFEMTVTQTDMQEPNRGGEISQIKTFTPNSKNKQVILHEL